MKLKQFLSDLALYGTGLVITGILSLAFYGVLYVILTTWK